MSKKPDNRVQILWKFGKHFYWRPSRSNVQDTSNVNLKVFDQHMNQLTSKEVTPKDANVKTVTQMLKDLLGL